MARGSERKIIDVMETQSQPRFAQSGFRDRREAGRLLALEIAGSGALEEEVGKLVVIGLARGAYVDTYGDASDAKTVLNLVWEARAASGVGQPADDVFELRWFAADELPADDELAFRWVATVLREWAGRQRS